MKTITIVTCRVVVVSLSTFWNRASIVTFLSLFIEYESRGASDMLEHYFVVTLNNAGTSLRIPVQGVTSALAEFTRIRTYCDVNYFGSLKLRISDPNENDKPR